MTWLKFCDQSISKLVTLSKPTPGKISMIMIFEGKNEDQKWILVSKTLLMPFKVLDPLRTRKLLKNLALLRKKSKNQNINTLLVCDEKVDFSARSGQRVLLV